MMDLLLTLAGFVTLVAGAELMVRGAVDLALRARISPLVIGLTVVSMGTSAPELLVSLVSAVHENSAISIGNVVGSNIVNISFFLGVSILVFPIEVDRDARRIHWPVMMGASLLFWWLFMDDLIAAWEGLLMLGLMVVYVWWMVWSSRRSTGVMPWPHRSSRGGRLLRCLHSVFSASRSGRTGSWLAALPLPQRQA